MCRPRLIQQPRSGARRWRFQCGKDRAGTTDLAIAPSSPIGSRSPPNSKQGLRWRRPSPSSARSIRLPNIPGRPAKAWRDRWTAHSKACGGGWGGRFDQPHPTGMAPPRNGTYPAISQSVPSHRRTLFIFGQLSDFRPVRCQSWPIGGVTGATGPTNIEEARLRLCAKCRP
jgi:hypothetical protein